MGRLSASLITLVLGAAAALALVSCGNGGGAALLPGSTAAQIESNLDQVQLLVGEGECIGAQNAAAEISAQVEDLSGVDKKLKQALSEGATRLNEVVGTCEEATVEEETEPAIETSEQTESTGKKEKQEGTKEPSTESEGPSLPPQSNGKGEENGQGEGRPEEGEGGSEPPSGGVAPSTPAGGE